MIEVFLDMTTAKAVKVATAEGGMCAIGAAAWTMGLPLDRMQKWQSDNDSVTTRTSNYLRGKGIALPEGSASMLFVPHDDMHTALDECYYALALAHGLRLIRNGQELDINFIIASPLDRRTWRIRKQQRRAAQQLELTAH